MLAKGALNGFFPRFNLGRGRTIPKYAKPLYFHFTVKARMEDPTLHYTPRAHWLEGTEEYVE